MATTPNMNLILPDVNITSGPTWASLLNAAYSVIDSHDHSTGNGVKVTPSGINITGDLSFNENNATNLRSARLYNNNIFLTGVNDRTCLYAEEGELHYIDAAGNDVQITDAGQIDVASTINTLTLRDSTFILQYFGDVTRQVQFDASAITPGQTRVFTLPDANSVLINGTSAQTLSNKTLIGPTVTDYEEFTNTTVPTTPTTGKTRLYVSSVDKVPHYVSDTGLDVPIGSGSSGAKNYLIAYTNFNIDPSVGMVTTLTTTGNRTASQTVWGSNVASLLSQDSTNKLRSVLSAKMVNASTSGNFIESPLFTLDPIDVNTNQLYISFDLYEPDSYAVAGNWTLSVIRYNSSGVYQETIIPSISQLPVNYYSFKCAFSHTSTTTDMYSLRWTSTSTNLLTMYIDSLFVGPQIAVDTNAIGPWTTYTPTFSAGFGTVTVPKGYYRRNGDSIDIQISGLAGTTTASVASVSLPPLLNIDTNKITASTLIGDPGITVGAFGDNQTASTGHMLVNALASTSVLYFGGLATGAVAMTPANANTICATGALISARATVPIATLGTSVTLAQATPIEYVFNTSSSDSNDTTSFGYGANGIAGVIGVTALTAPRSKRVRFQNPIQPTDRIQVEIKNNTGVWMPVSATDAASKISSLLIQNSVQYGIGITSTFINSTDLDITFGTYSYPSGATYGSVGNGWSTGLTGYLWRVAKFSAVGLSELAPATEISSGTISRDSGWKPYTPIFAGFTATSISAFYRILGNTITVTCICKIASTSAAVGEISLPSGYFADGTKVPTSTSGPSAWSIIGNWGCSNSSTSSDTSGFITAISSPSFATIRISGSTESRQSILGNPTTSSIFNVGYAFSFKFEVPIL